MDLHFGLLENLHVRARTFEACSLVDPKRAGTRFFLTSQGGMVIALWQSNQAPNPARSSNNFAH